ncbi:MAG: hypothetical protein ACM3NO_00110 [Deltaproteobacteria bacterium]
MNRQFKSRIGRREFLNKTALAGGLALTANLGADAPQKVAILADPGDPVANAKPAEWAAGELERSLLSRGLKVGRIAQLGEANSFDLCIVSARATHTLARPFLHKAGITIPEHAEALGLVPGKLGGKEALLAAGTDSRGLVYALLELADRVQYSSGPLEALRLTRPVIEKPANSNRVINRIFASDVEDKPWYNDRAFWLKYFSMLAAQRFNRFCLSFGLAYDFTRNITDCYFHFPYPFLLAVPGYDVRAAGLPDEERDHNLEMLRFISDQAAARGLDFQLGLWTHAYVWHDSPEANYTITGLTPETHAAYCRDALTAVLRACPAIGSLAFRIHGESGVAEGSYDFWKTVFSAAAASGRKLEINLHAKGIDQRMIDVALGTGMPVSVSPKFWAEHMGLPYHQASIRELEKPPRGREVNKFFALSSGSRSFMRYGYGDLLTKDRKFKIYTRVWPGTERLLLWGDPLTAAAYGRDFSFCGESGVDLFEPLSFKGRRGSGLPGGRCAYADASLKPEFDWEKFSYTYRMWGRHLYNPETSPEVYRRFLTKQFGPAAAAVESALAFASRILPLITTAHGPSAANNIYWPEMYTNMPMVDNGKRSVYSDTPSPKVFGNASTFDPELFSSVNEFAVELLMGPRSGKISPIDVAQWLEDIAESAGTHLAEARSKTRNPQEPEFRRMAVDVTVQSGLGRFFAAKFRSGVLFAIFQKSGHQTALRESFNAYRQARKVWAEMAESATGVYVPDVTFGPEKHLRGHWQDRLEGIDADIAEIEKLQGSSDAQKSESANIDTDRVARAIQEAMSRPVLPRREWKHTPAAHFNSGSPLEVRMTIQASSATERISSVRLHYRHVNQAEEYVMEEMKSSGGEFTAAIPGNYTDSPYPLEYFFEVHNDRGAAWLLPGFDPNQPRRPYFVVQSEN